MLYLPMCLCRPQLNLIFRSILCNKVAMAQSVTESHLSAGADPDSCVTNNAAWQAHPEGLKMVFPFPFSFKKQNLGIYSLVRNCSNGISHDFLAIPEHSLSLVRTALYIMIAISHM